MQPGYKGLPTMKKKTNFVSILVYEVHDVSKINNFKSIANRLRVNICSKVYILSSVSPTQQLAQIQCP